MAPEYFPFKIGCEMREKRTKRWTSARNIDLYGTKSAERHGLPESKSLVTSAGTSASTGG
jgi:hypothetical protein